MISRILTIFAFLLLSAELFGQGLMPSSVSSTSLANSDIVSRDGNVFAINPSSVHSDSLTNGLAGIAFMPFRGGLDHAAEYAAGIAYTFTDIATSISVSFTRLGYEELFSNETSSLTLSHHFSSEKLRRASLGVRTRYESIGFTSEYEKIHRIIIDFGGEMLFTNQFAVGFMTLNLLGASMNTIFEEEKVPRTYSLGVEYSPIETGLSLYTTLEKRTDRDLLARFGIGYSPFEFITVRTGITSSFESYSFGFGVHMGGIIIDGAFVLYEETGESLSIGMSFAW